MITDPRFAPRRTDLPWLRRRRLPRPAAAPATASTPSSSAVQDFLSGHSTHHHPAQPQATPPQPTRQPPPPPRPTEPHPTQAHPTQVHPTRGRPPQARPTPPRPTRQPPPPPPSRAAGAPAPTPSNPLDLDAPSAGASPPPPAPPVPSPPPARVSSSLDLDEPTTPAAPPPPAAPAPDSPRRRRRVDRRVHAGDRTLLTPSDPTVTLTRLQSGIGTLTIDAAISAEVGDLRLGAAYELSDGFQMTMQMAQGNRFAPPHSKRPVLVGSRDRFERIGVDLRQCRTLRRLIVYGFSEGRRPLTWGGTLVVTTFGGARIELPMDSLQGGDIAVLLSVYQVDGEFVLRGEMQSLYGDVREACRAYGYDRITWLDDRTPVE